MTDTHYFFPPARAYPLNRCLYLLKSDAGFRARFLADPEAAMGELGLDGETRAALIEDGRIVEARILREGVVPAGTVLEARLKAVGRNAVAIANGQEYLLPKGTPGVTEGARLNIEVTREALGGMEQWKRPLARATDEAPRPAPTIDDRDVGGRELDEAGWDELLEEARSGLVRFPGGELRVSLTPAITRAWKWKRGWLTRRSW